MGGPEVPAVEELLCGGPHSDSATYGSSSAVLEQSCFQKLQTEEATPRRPPSGGVLRSAKRDNLVLPVALDQVRVDRCGEARFVQLEADELTTALDGASPASRRLHDRVHRAVPRYPPSRDHQISVTCFDVCEHR